MDAASVLRAARRASGLSQARYAEAVGVSQPAISAYEHGRREPSLSTLARLVRGSGRTLRLDLVWDDGDLPPAADDTERALRLVDLLGLADAIPHERRGDLTMPRMDSR